MTKKVLNVLKYVFLSVISFISVFPLVWMVIAATNKSVDITRGTLIPGTYLIENIKSVLVMIVSSAAGYAFVIYRSKARERVFSLILLSMMVPFAALMVPLFRMFSKFNDMGPLKAIALNTPMSVLIMTIPTALIFFFMQKQFVAGMTGSVKG